MKTRFQKTVAAAAVTLAVVTVSVLPVVRHMPAPIRHCSRLKTGSRTWCRVRVAVLPQAWPCCLLWSVVP